MITLRHFASQFTAMGSGCEIQLYAQTQRAASRAIDSVRGNIRRLEQRYSRYLTGNVLFQINRTARAGELIEVDAETAALLDYAAACHQQSDGLFDISSGILRKAWNFKSGRLADAGEVRALLEKIGWEKIIWNNPVLAFGAAGMELDFGGIVKEYAADQCAALCQDQGIEHGMINLGGDIRIIGPHPDRSPWLIGIRHPRLPGRHLRTLSLSQGGVSTSGDYERCIRIGERFYSHLLNPKTGWPVSGLASVTVVADFSLIAGSASTIAMLNGAAGGQWLRNNAFQALWVDENGKVEHTFSASGRAGDGQPVLNQV